MIPVGLAPWMVKHGVTFEAMQELAQITGLMNPPPVPPPPIAQMSESYVQSLVRLEAPRAGVYLFRNNLGAMPDANGRYVRFGLGNDSAKLNEVLKSGDLIGWRPFTVTPGHVGRTVAQFLSREVKPVGWTYSGTPREVAQLNWANLVNAHGGDAKFATGVGTL